MFVADDADLQIRDWATDALVAVLDAALVLGALRVRRAHYLARRFAGALGDARESCVALVLRVALTPLARRRFGERDGSAK